MSEYKKTALVLGAGGFIGSHMVKRLRSEGYWVRGVDLKCPEFSNTEANEFVQGDLRDVEFGCYTYIEQQFLSDNVTDATMYASTLPNTGSDNQAQHKMCTGQRGQRERISVRCN